jgi:hypothetical protein
MGNQSFLDRVRGWIGGIAFNVFLWANRMTAEQYDYHVHIGCKPIKDLLVPEFLLFKAHIDAAHKMVSDLCHRKREWIMSIPARFDYDPDLIIGQALRDADKMLLMLQSADTPSDVRAWLADAPRSVKE